MRRLMRLLLKVSTLSVGLLMAGCGAELETAVGRESVAEVTAAAPAELAQHADAPSAHAPHARTDHAHTDHDPAATTLAAGELPGTSLYHLRGAWTDRAVETSHWATCAAAPPCS